MTAADRIAHRVMVDGDLDDQLHEQGIVRFPALSETDVAALQELYWSTVPVEAGLQLDYLRTDVTVRRKLTTGAGEIVNRALAPVLERHRAVYTSFVVKYPDEDSAMFLHRDLPIADERTERAYSIWIALDDTGPALDNGPFAIVPDSHLLPHGAFGLRGPALFSPYHRTLTELLVPLSTPAGEALLYDARLLHASGPNRTELPRLALGCLLAREGISPVHVVPTGRRHRVLQRIDPGFFIDHHPIDIFANGMPADCEIVAEWDETPSMTPAAVAATLGLPDEPGRDAQVPPDLRSDRVEHGRLRIRRGVEIADSHDVVLAAADLGVGEFPAGPTDTSSGLTVRVAGSASMVDIRRRGRSLAHPSAQLPPLGRRTSSASLAVLDAGARLTLTAPERTGRIDDVVVVDAPALGSGALCAGNAADLAPGDCIELVPGNAITLWNDGPGALVLITRVRWLRR